MGFFDFLKKKKTKTEQSEYKTLKFSDLQEFLDTEKKNAETKNKEFLTNVRQRLSQLIEELKEEKSILEGLDLKSKREPEKVKQVVLENLGNYVFYLSQFIEDIENISESSPEAFIKKLNTCFFDFQKRSMQSFQKATILIGKEIGEVGESLNNFSRDLKGIMQENEEFVTRSKIIEQVFELLIEKKESEKIKLTISKSIENINYKIQSFQNKIKILDEGITNIKNSEEYSEREATIKEFDNKKEELKKEISSLKKLIDFKKLANIFHSSEKKLKIVQDYNSNFHEMFDKHSGDKLFSLLEEANTNSGQIKDKIDLIDEKTREIKAIVIEEDETETLEREKARTKEEIKSLERDIEKENKRLENIEQEISELKGSIKSKLSEINVVVEL